VSGIVGLVHLDGSPIDRQLLGRMTSFLAFRGPDACQVWSDGAVGLGHTLLRTTDESAHEQQPFTLDQQVWIVADARIDAREDLVRKLVAKGRSVARSAPDVELVLHAYIVWGEECVGHLLGDFCFAVWDARHRRLFCARDHLGVNQFYYACLGNRFTFSNSLNCVRLDPAVSSHLDDSVIGDLLLLNYNSEPSATAFAEIRRLAPAHVLLADDKGVRLRRYWTLPVEEEIRYRRETDYVDQFRDLLRLAVRDRLRAPRAALMMSGGLDSSSVAAMAASTAPHGSDRLKAFTLFYDRLIPDEEKRYAGLVSQSLHIPIQFLAADCYNLFDGWEDAAARPAEPHPEVMIAAVRDLLKQSLTFSRTILTGQGGDPTLCASVSQHAGLLLRQRRLGRLFRDFGRFLRAEGRLSRLYLGTRWRVFRHRHTKLSELPPWLNPEFAAQFPYAERMARAMDEVSAPQPLRPHAYHSLRSPAWPDQFALYDPDTTRLPVQFAHPYFDLRLIRFLLRVSPVPWCTDKEIVRRALRGFLPDSVRLRRKSPLARDTTPDLLKRRNQWWESVPAAPGSEQYIQWESLPRPSDVSRDQAWFYVSTVGLNLWMTAQSELRRLNGPGRTCSSFRPGSLEASC